MEKPDWINYATIGLSLASFVFSLLAFGRTQNWDRKKRRSDARVDELKRHVDAPMETAFQRLAIFQAKLRGLSLSANVPVCRETVQDRLAPEAQNIIGELAPLFQRAQTCCADCYSVSRARLNEIEDEVTTSLEHIIDLQQMSRVQAEIERLCSWLDERMAETRNDINKRIMAAMDPKSAG